MSIQKVREYLKHYNMEKDIIEFSSSSATVLKAAECLNCNPAHIAKTLAFKVLGDIILIVMAGDARIDNSKFKVFFHEKASMLKFDEVELLIGHQVGGVCPFAVNDDVKIYLDNSLKRFKYIYPACGSANSAIKLTIEQLEMLSKYLSWIDVTKIEV